MGKKNSVRISSNYFFRRLSELFFSALLGNRFRSVDLGGGGRATQIVAQTKTRVDSERFNHELRWRASGSGVKTWEVRTQIGPTTHVAMHSWRPKAERGVELTTVLMHSKKNGRPVDTMTTFVENTESALSSGADEMAFKILKNKRDWCMKTPAGKAGGRSRGGNRRNADGQVADSIITVCGWGVERGPNLVLKRINEMSKR